jgi:hypothetical protein
MKKQVGVPPDSPAMSTRSKTTPQSPALNTRSKRKLPDLNCSRWIVFSVTCCKLWIFCGDLYLCGLQQVVAVLAKLRTWWTTLAAIILYVVHLCMLVSLTSD